MSARTSLSRHPASAAAGRNMIAIASGKGGVGKTWLSITLAHALARMGRRVLLFDGDLGLANVDIQLGLAVATDLRQVIAGRIDAAGAVTRFAEGGFDILAGPSGSGSLAALDSDRLVRLRDQVFALAATYDLAIADLGAGVEPSVRTLSDASGLCLVVTTDEPTALTDAYAFIKLTLQARPAADLRIVVNAAEDEKSGRRTHETLHKACASFLKRSPPLAGVIRRDSKIRESIRAQTPLLTRYPNCVAAGDVEAIARALPGAR
jgi:flagellar biosynthesis protein FlhG